MGLWPMQLSGWKNLPLTIDPGFESRIKYFFQYFLIEEMGTKHELLSLIYLICFRHLFVPVICCPKNFIWRYFIRMKRNNSRYLGGVNCVKMRYRKPIYPPIYYYYFFFFVKTEWSLISTYMAGKDDLRREGTLLLASPTAVVITTGVDDVITPAGASLRTGVVTVVTFDAIAVTATFNGNSIECLCWLGGNEIFWLLPSVVNEWRLWRWWWPVCIATVFGLSDAAAKAIKALGDETGDGAVVMSIPRVVATALLGGPAAVATPWLLRGPAAVATWLLCSPPAIATGRLPSDDDGGDTFVRLFALCDEELWLLLWAWLDDEEECPLDCWAAKGGLLSSHFAESLKSTKDIGKMPMRSSRRPSAQCSSTRRITVITSS